MSNIQETTQTNELNLDNFDLDSLDFDVMLGDFADVAVEGGFDGDNDDSCVGGACKI